MYLVNVETLDLKYFSTIEKAATEGYVTLSHRWSEEPDDELTFQEVESKSEAMKRKPGYSKMLQAAQVVRWLFPWKWIWIDTCCIDKKSSAELQEAINSMWEIYTRSCCCLAYLSDVTTIPCLPWRQSETWTTSPSDPTTRIVEKKVDTATDKPISHAQCTGQSVLVLRTRTAVFLEDCNHEELKGSQWFNRGWTLQELLAPPEVLFFNNEWNRIGSRTGLHDTITSITGIPSACLGQGRSLDWRQRYCAATKMSWAAYRNTTRPEDRAYSLLGIFDIHMPLLYGEGENAFRRL